MYKHLRFQKRKDKQTKKQSKRVGNSRASKYNFEVGLCDAEFMCQLDWVEHRMFRYLVNRSSKSSVRVFWIRLTSELVDCLKQISLPSVGGPHPLH